MNIALIGDYECTYNQGDEPALVIHHVVRGYDAVSLDSATANELRELLAVAQKRIRELGSYQVMFGAAGDVAFYTTSGQRTCYLTAEQAAQLARMLRRI